MRVDLSKKWTFLVCGHAQTGKTSLVESILFKCHAINRLGKAADGTTVSDYEDDEKARKSSINLSVLHAEYKDNFLQFIDVPGYFDFIGELNAAGRAVDFAVIVVDAVYGVQLGTEKAWEMVKRENIPCIFFINRLDDENADFEKVITDIQTNLIKDAVPLVDWVNHKLVSVLKDKNNRFYNQVVEKIAESDDQLIEKYLNSGALDDKEIGAAMEKAAEHGCFYPILAGIAVQETGTEELLDFIISEMPSVAQTVPRKIKKAGKEIAVEPKVEAPLVAQVFKTIIDPFVGQLTLFRLYSGKISANSEVYNVTKGGKEKIGNIAILQGKQLVAQDAICAGEIGVAAKLKDVSTLDVLCDSNDLVEFPAIDFPEPVFSLAVKPKTRQDDDKISTALARLTSEDPTFKVSRNGETKELIISGMGELHLHVIIDRMRKRYGVDVNLEAPKIPLKETVTRSVKVQGKHKKQSGGHGQYGDCWIEVAPLERGKHYEFVDNIVGGAIPRNFIPSVEKGIVKAMDEGILAGYPVTDIRVTLYDGSYHDVDSSDIAFQIAGALAFRKAMEEAGSVLLEPIMSVKITVPEEFMGQVTGDINSKRGRVLGMEVKGKNQILQAQLPLAEMSKYASDLRSITGGRGSYTMKFSHHDIVPARISQNIILQAKQDKKEPVNHH